MSSLAHTVHQPMASTMSRSNSGKVPTILVYTGSREVFDKTARTFSDANALCSLFPVDSRAAFHEAMAYAHTFDAVIVALDLIDDEPAAALAVSATACPQAAQFILTGVENEADLPPMLLRTGADAIPDRNIAALPYVVDNIMRERRTTHLVQRALSEHEQMFGVLVSHIEDAMWVCTANVDRILYLSPAFSRIWGVDERELYENPRNWLKYIHADDRDRYVRTIREQALLGQGFTIEYRVQRPDGKMRVVRDQGYPISDDNGVFYRLGGIMHDITEDRRLQEELRLSNRLEAVGQLAAGIAHEINTPAQFISDNLRFVRDGLKTVLEVIDHFEPMARGRKCADNEQVDKLLEDKDFAFLREDLPLAIEQSLDGIQRVATIVRAMKEFSHPGSSLPEPTDLNETIRSAVTVSRNEWKYVADLGTELDADLPAVICHRQAISQVLVNLIVNAAHAVEQRGRHDSMGRITVSSSSADAWVAITVRDQGVGIAPENRMRIFDQFYTTKEVGKGTGQGLALAWRTVVEGHGGRIECDSEVGVGTAFTVRLPIAGPAQLGEETPV